MDIEMQAMNGIEAVKVLKEKHPEVKNSDGDNFSKTNEKIFQSLCNGAEGYILKSTSPVQILSSIKEIL